MKAREVSISLLLHIEILISVNSFTDMKVNVSIGRSSGIVARNSRSRSNIFKELMIHQYNKLLPSMLVNMLMLRKSQDC